MKVASQPSPPRSGVLPVQDHYLWDGRSRRRGALQYLLVRGDRLLWIKQRIRGGCIRSTQHRVLTTDGPEVRVRPPFRFTVCLELDFATPMQALRSECSTRE
jgi:hypothetical protein